MAIYQIQKLTKIELKVIKGIIAEAFVPNELFHNWGSAKLRHEDVIKYMDAYVDYVYKSKQLYANDALIGFIGIEDSRHPHKFRKLGMLVKMIFKIKWSRLKKILNYANEISASNQKYSKKPHLECAMLCVKTDYQGMGYASELIRFALSYAKKENIPMLFDTDVKRYKEMYEHFGIVCYNQVRAKNGVTRYSLVYKDFD